jgi:hypothetical protein
MVQAQKRLMASKLALCVLILVALSSCQLPNFYFPDSGGFSNSNLPEPPYAYVSDSSGSGHVYQCSVNVTTGLLSNCISSNGGVEGWSPTKITLQSINDNTVAYVTDNGENSLHGYGNVYLCQINEASGALEDCSASNGGMSFWNPYTIGLTTQGMNTYAYVSGGTESVYKCSVSSITGGLSGCIVSNGGYSEWTPSGVSIVNSAGTTYAYFADTNGEVSEFGAITCAVNSANGTLGSCTKNDVGTVVGDGGFSDIAIATVGGNTYAYLADTSYDIYVCSIDTETGAISSCNQNIGGMPSWQPTSITMASFGSNTFAYVSDGFSMVVCQVNSSDGNLSSCEETESELSWKPTSIFVQ